MNYRALGMVAAGAVFLVACAHQPIPEAHDLPGFFSGLFHGLTAIFALIGSLFWQIRIYAYPNGGFWYDFGFMLGFSFSLLIIFVASMARIGGLLS